MANAVYSLRKVALGFESVYGTAVATTALFTGEATIEPIFDRELEDYPNGVPWDVIGSDITVWKACAVNFETSLDFEQVLYPLLTGIKLVAPTTDTDEPQTWEVVDDGGALEVGSLTLEAQYTDGSSNHHQVKVAGLVTTQIEFVFAARSRAILRWRMIGQPVATSFTPTSGLSVLTRTPLASQLMGVAINDSWDDLGDTQKTGLVRAGTLRIDTRIADLDPTLDGQANLSSLALMPRKFGGQWSSTMSLNAAAGTEKDKALVDVPAGRFVRLFEDNGASGEANRQLILDFAGVYSQAPTFTRDGELEIMSANLALRGDSSGNIFAATVINGYDDVPGEES